MNFKNRKTYVNEGYIYTYLRYTLPTLYGLLPMTEWLLLYVPSPCACLFIYLYIYLFVRMQKYFSSSSFFAFFLSFIMTVSWCSTMWRRAADGRGRTRMTWRIKGELKGESCVCYFQTIESAWKSWNFFLVLFYSFFLRIIPSFIRSSAPPTTALYRGSIGYVPDEQKRALFDLGDRYETAASHNQMERNEETDSKNSKSLLFPFDRLSLSLSIPV